MFSELCAAVMKQSHPSSSSCPFMIMNQPYKKLRDLLTSRKLS